MIITKPFFVSSKSCPYVIVTVILYAGAFSFNTILLTVSRTTVKRILINRNDGLTIFFSLLFRDSSNEESSRELRKAFERYRQRSQIRRSSTFERHVTVKEVNVNVNVWTSRDRQRSQIRRSSLLAACIQERFNFNKMLFKTWKLWKVKIILLPSVYPLYFFPFTDACAYTINIEINLRFKWNKTQLITIQTS
jgi:hypothetical protein